MTDRTSTAYVAVNPSNGNVWVGVPFENLFWIFSPDGKYLESWGKSGTGEGQFDFNDHQPSPNGFTPIAFAPDGSFFVGDTGNYRVQAFDAQRNFIRQWGDFGGGNGEFVQIVSIATDGTTVYVADGDHYNIQAFDLKGNYLRTFGGDAGYNCVAVDANGRVYVTNPGTTTDAPNLLAIFDAGGDEITSTELGMPTLLPLQLAVDAAGNGYVPLQIDHYPWEDQGVLEFDPTGHVVGLLAGGGEFVAVAPDGRTLYVARGSQLDTTQWTFVRAYALPVS